MRNFSVSTESPENCKMVLGVFKVQYNILDLILDLPARIRMTEAQIEKNKFKLEVMRNAQEGEVV